MKVVHWKTCWGSLKDKLALTDFSALSLSPYFQLPVQNEVSENSAGEVGMNEVISLFHFVT